MSEHTGFLLSLLLNQTGIHLPGMQKGQSTDTRLWWSKVQLLVQGIKQGEWEAYAQILNSPTLSGKRFWRQGEGCGLQGAWSIHEQAFSWLMVR